MRVNVFAVYDSKAATYGQPFFSPTIGSAMRAFHTACLDPQSMLAKHPADFSLMQLGTFDDDTGELIGLNPPVNIGLAANFKEHAHV